MTKKQLNKEKNMKMTINFTNNQINVNREFVKKASICGSEEYKKLLSAVKELKNFEVVIK